MGWRVRRSKLSGVKILCTCPAQPWGPPSLLYNGYWVLPEVKKLGRGVGHPEASSAEVKG